MVSRRSSLGDIKNFVKACLSKVYTKDSDLFCRNQGRGVSERCVVFRFAYYLQCRLTQFFVDCDFNSSYHGHFENGNIVWEHRNGKPITNPDGTVTYRFVDIIIHKRNNFEKNQANQSDFLCFEIKKWNNRNKKQIGKDKNNLHVMTSEYGYVYGFFINFGRDKESSTWTIFQNGQEIETNSRIF